MDPDTTGSTSYLIEGVGDEVTCVIAFMVFVLSILGSIQLFPESISFLRTLYQSYFEPQEEHGSGNTLNTATMHEHDNRSEAVRNENEIQVNHESDQNSENIIFPLNNSVEQEADDEASLTHSSPSVTETDKSDSEIRNLNESLPNPNIPERQQTAAENSSEVTANEEPLSRTAITIRLKYLNDTERTVTSEPTAMIGDFKRLNFVEELSLRKRVRLIFNGQLLRDEITLQAYGILDGTVIHVQISQPQNSQTSQANSNSGDLDLAAFLWPLFSIMLAIFWFLYIKYPEYFTAPSVVILIAFSISFLLVYVRVQVHPL